MWWETGIRYTPKTSEVNKASCPFGQMCHDLVQMGFACKCLLTQLEIFMIVNWCGAIIPFVQVLVEKEYKKRDRDGRGGLRSSPCHHSIVFQNFLT